MLKPQNMPVTLLNRLRQNFEELLAKKIKEDKNLFSLMPDATASVMSGLVILAIAVMGN